MLRLEKIEGLVKQMNEQKERDTTADDPIGKIVQTVDRHLDSLKWVEENTEELQKKVEEVKRKRSL